MACICGDAPVCNFKSWPGGKGIGPGSEPDWQTCLKEFGFTEQIALTSPVRNVRHCEEGGTKTEAIALNWICGFFERRYYII